MSESATSTTVYNYKVVKQFTVMTVVWGIVGMLVGVILAAQLVWPGASGIYSFFSRHLGCNRSFGFGPRSGR